MGLSGSALEDFLPSDILLNYAQTTGQFATSKQSEDSHFN